MSSAEDTTRRNTIMNGVFVALNGGPHKPLTEEQLDLYEAIQEERAQAFQRKPADRSQ